MTRTSRWLISLLLYAGTSAIGCAGAPPAEPPSVTPAQPEPETITAHALVSSAHTTEQNAALHQSLLSQDVLRDAGITEEQIVVTRNDNGVRVEVTAQTAPLATAQCNSVVLAARLHAARTPTEPRWLDKGVERLREEMSRLNSCSEIRYTQMTTCSAGLARSDAEAMP